MWFTDLMGNSTTAFAVVHQLRELSGRLIRAGFIQVRPGRYTRGVLSVATSYTNNEATVEIEDDYGVIRYRGLQPRAWFVDFYGAVYL